MLMQRVRQMERRQPHGTAREALLAATLLHLGPGDLVSAPVSDRTMRELAPASPGQGSSHDLPPNLRLPLCAGAARGMQTAGTDRLTLAYAEARTPEAGWADALTWAQRDQLPMLLVCADVQSRAKTRSNTRAHLPLTWPAVTQLARRIKLPVFPVDGHDAVAVYRVVQESSARARTHGGPSVLWAVLSSDRLPRREQPLARLEAYMADRNIPLPS
jgi:pyruvate dehydrogenase E1 component alpha subunit